MNKMILPLFSVFTFMIVLSSPVFAVSSSQATGSVNIVNFVPLPEGGTLSFVTPQQMTINFTLPDGVSGELLVAPTDVQNPTTNGFAISFLAEVLTIKINPPDACITGCKITFTFDDNHLSSTGISDPSQVVIYQDSNEDGTFVPLPTILIDDAPSPYTVLATITSTSFFGIGVLEGEVFCGKTISVWTNLGANIIIGTNGSDAIHGTNGMDVIIAKAGNDVVYGKDGDDCIVGGPGRDRLNGGKGNDMIFGNDSNDVIHGNDGNDVIDGGSGNDTIQGNNGNDIINGSVGNDKIYGNNGTDLLYGEAGNDQIFGGNQNDTIDGGPGTDRCNGGNGINSIINCEDKHKEKDDHKEKGKK